MSTLDVVKVAMGRLPLLSALGAGALVVHDLRYRIAFGAEAETVLARQGHHYLEFVGPLTGMLVATSAAMIITRWSRGHRPRGATGRWWLWFAFSLALSAVYVGQESVEGALSADHPGGIAAVFGHRGWLALVIAVVVGGVLALLVRLADDVARRLSLGRRSIACGTRTSAVVIAASAVRRLVRNPLADQHAGRAPPGWR